MNLTLILLLATTAHDSESLNGEFLFRGKLNQFKSFSKNRIISSRNFVNCSITKACGPNTDCFNGNSSILCLCKCGFAGDPNNESGCIVLDRDLITRFEFGIKFLKNFPINSTSIEMLLIEVAKKIEKNFIDYKAYAEHSLSFQSKGYVLNFATLRELAQNLLFAFIQLRRV